MARLARAPLLTRSGHGEALFDHLVGSGKQRWKRSEAERLGRLEAMTTSNWIRLTA
jgi:hypothetical protein